MVVKVKQQKKTREGHLVQKQQQILDVEMKHGFDFTNK